MAVCIINIFNMFLKPSPLIYNVQDTYFTNLSEICFILNHRIICLNILKCPQ